MSKITNGIVLFSLLMALSLGVAFAESEVAATENETMNASVNVTINDDHECDHKRNSQRDHGDATDRERNHVQPIRKLKQPVSASIWHDSSRLYWAEFQGRIFLPVINFCIDNAKKFLERLIFFWEYIV